MRATVFALMGLLFCVNMQAKVGGPTDFFGKWKFTSTMEVTEVGKEYADLFKAECEVEMTSHVVYDIAIVGFGGATGKQMVNRLDLENNKLIVANPNPSQTSMWPNSIYMSNVAGDYPFGGSWSLEYEFDPTTKAITMPDFTAVTVNHEMQSAVVLAKFTNCKMTLEEQEVVVVDDMSGDFHFTAAGQTKPESTFPTEFDMTLTSENEQFTAYTVEMSFEGYDPIKIAGATFDGNQLTIPFDETYIDKEQTMLFSGLYNPEVKGTIVFNKVSESAFSLYSGITIRMKEEDDKGVYGGETVQYYISGLAVKPMTGFDFVGTYTVTCAEPVIVLEDYDYPKEFEFEVIQSEANGKYYMTKFMGNDIKSMNYGGIPCELKDNVLEIAVSSTNSPRYLRSVSRKDDFSEMYYDVLLDGLGEMKLPVKLTANADGTVTMDDFSIFRMEIISGKSEAAAYYMSLTVTKNGTGVSAVREDAKLSVRAENGVIYVAGGVEMPLEVYNAAGQCVFSGVASRVAGLTKGLYIVKSGAATAKVSL